MNNIDTFTTLISLNLAALVVGFVAGFPLWFKFLLLVLSIFLISCLVVYSRKYKKIMEQVSKQIYYPYKGIIIEHEKNNLFVVKNYDDKDFNWKIISYIKIGSNKIYVSKDKNFKNSKEILLTNLENLEKILNEERGL
ncbi:MAG: hypothetical protein PHO23_00435 [Candidatus Pacebacteria bacterium]|nr:hypothetical protein [Candidatus Paceibacterota bacterium]